MSPIVEYCNGIFRHTIHRKRNILGWKMNTTMIATHTHILLMSNMSFIEHGFMNRLALFTVYTAHVTSIPKSSMNKRPFKKTRKTMKTCWHGFEAMQYSLPVIYFSSTNIYQCCDCYWKHRVQSHTWFGFFLLSLHSRSLSGLSSRAQAPWQKDQLRDLLFKYTSTTWRARMFERWKDGQNNTWWAILFGRESCCLQSLI